jgi:hypothetical protein
MCLDKIFDLFFFFLLYVAYVWLRNTIGDSLSDVVVNHKKNIVVEEKKRERREALCL